MRWTVNQKYPSTLVHLPQNMVVRRPNPLWTKITPVFYTAKIEKYTVESEHLGKDYLINGIFWQKCQNFRS